MKLFLDYNLSVFLAKYSNELYIQPKISCCYEKWAVLEKKARKKHVYFLRTNETSMANVPKGLYAVRNQILLHEYEYTCFNSNVSIDHFAVVEM